MSKQYKKNQATVLEVLVVSIFKGLWWLIKLPFGGLKKKPKIGAHDIGYIRSKRSEIEALLDSESSIELKHAVMEADKLVDYTLKLYGYAGETFADRLRSAEKYIDRNVYQAIWWGHKVRNQIAHEHGNEIAAHELKLAAKNLLTYLRKI